MPPGSRLPAEGSASDDAALQARLCYQFVRPGLLVQALTHSSAMPGLRLATPAVPQDSRVEHKLPAANNERLEFLGDAVLELLVSEFLLATFPNWAEGQLSKGRARIVNSYALEAAARRLRIGEHLRIGRGEEKTGGREKQTLLADAFEAIVAAMYLDGGLDVSRQFLHRTLFDFVPLESTESISESDRKSALQEFLQARGQVPAEYRLVAETGPDHQKSFQIDVMVEGQRLATGSGSNKKEAEQRAAGIALKQLISESQPPSAEVDRNA